MIPLGRSHELLQRAHVGPIPLPAAAHHGNLRTEFIRSPEVHTTQPPSLLDGLWFPICSCGANGKGLLSEWMARGWICTRQLAEWQVEADRKELERAAAYVASLYR
jgi:hypothetical protein